MSGCCRKAPQAIPNQSAEAEIDSSIPSRILRVKMDGTTLSAGSHFAFWVDARNEKGNPIAAKGTLIFRFAFKGNQKANATREVAFRTRGDIKQEYIEDNMACQEFLNEGEYSLRVEYKSDDGRTVMLGPLIDVIYRKVFTR
jgi:hypothetical protein